MALSTIDTCISFHRGGILMEFDEPDDELIDTTEAIRCSSDVSALIHHYRAFSNTLQANSAIGVLERIPPKSSAAKDQKVKPAPVPVNGMATGPVPGLVVVHEPPHNAKSIPPGLFVVIPTHNNELIIGSLVHLCRQYAELVIVVDEDPDDRTAEIATDAGAHLVLSDPDAGKTRAIICTNCTSARTPYGW